MSHVTKQCMNQQVLLTTVTSQREYEIIHVIRTFCTIFHSLKKYEIYISQFLSKHNFATRLQLHCTLLYPASLSTFQCPENCEQQYHYGKIHTIQRTTYITKKKKEKFPPCPHYHSFWLTFLHTVHPTSVLLH